MNAGVPIVPVVSIGGQESQLFITRGDRLARTFRLDKLLRSKVLPFSFGFPFGPSAVIPPNIPLPTKIVTEVLAPIDIEREFGPDADPSVVDCHVRKVMQCALDQLAAKRRYPILG
jgi:1-acyl-sn-glycerol-3-phosphate acyltransferase